MFPPGSADVRRARQLSVMWSADQSATRDTEEPAAVVCTVWWCISTRIFSWRHLGRKSVLLHNTDGVIINQRRIKQQRCSSVKPVLGIRNNIYTRVQIIIQYSSMRWTQRYNLLESVCKPVLQRCIVEHSKNNAMLFNSILFFKKKEGLRFMVSWFKLLSCYYYLLSQEDRRFNFIVLVS